MAQSYLTTIHFIQPDDFGPSIQGVIMVKIESTRWTHCDMWSDPMKI